MPVHFAHAPQSAHGTSEGLMFESFTHLSEGPGMLLDASTQQGANTLVTAETAPASVYCGKVRCCRKRGRGGALAMAEGVRLDSV